MKMGINKRVRFDLTKRALTHGIANKGFSGLRSLVVRFNFYNGGQERLPAGRQVARNPLLAIPRDRWWLCMNATFKRQKSSDIKRKIMKTLPIILTMILIFNFIGCDKEESHIIKNITPSSISFTNCNSGTKSTDSNIPSVRLIGQSGNILLLKLSNTEFCCGTDSISISKNIVDNKISIEIIDNGPFTYCFCSHDLEFTIGPFDNDDYVLKMIESEHAYSRDTFLIHFSYSLQLDTTVTRTYPNNLLISIDSMSTDNYYSIEIFSSQNSKIYGKWNLKEISGGIHGNGYEPNFDYLEARNIGIYGLIRNDSLLEFGKISIDEQNVESLLIKLIPDINSDTFLFDSEKYVDLYGNDTLVFLAPCCDRFNYHFIRTE